MISHQEPQRPYREGNSSPVDENTLENAEKYRKTRPSVNVGLAQGYKGRQGLPTAEQGVSPETEEHPEDASSDTNSEYIKIGLDESLVSLQRRTRRLWLGEDDNHLRGTRTSLDSVTGRKQSHYDRACLRCIEKGLRCTLNFAGKENEAQCAACRRSKTQYCVRFRPPTENEEGRFWDGLPWKNPNFVAGTSKSNGKGSSSQLPREELEEMVREFYHGRPGYVSGDYVTQFDVRNFALPSFKPVIEQGRFEYEQISWRDVLPNQENKSLQARQARQAFGGMNEQRIHNERNDRPAAARDEPPVVSVGSIDGEAGEGVSNGPTIKVTDDR